MYTYAYIVTWPNIYDGIEKRTYTRANSPSLFLPLWFRLVHVGLILLSRSLYFTQVKIEKLFKAKLRDGICFLGYYR